MQTYYDYIYVFPSVSWNNLDFHFPRVLLRPDLERTWRSVAPSKQNQRFLWESANRVAYPSSRHNLSIHSECRVTNYQKPSSLKQYAFVTLQFPGVRSLLVPTSRSHNATRSCLGYVLIWRFKWGEPASRLTQVLGRNRLLGFVGLEARNSYWLLAAGHLYVLEATRSSLPSMGNSQQGSLCLQVREGTLSLHLARQFGFCVCMYVYTVIIVGLTSYHFCHILG